MNFLKFSLLVIVCSLVVGLMPAFFRFAFNDKQTFEASVISSRMEMSADKSKTASSIRVIATEKFKILVYMADNAEKRTKGLGGLSSIPPDYGMFFIFDGSDYISIWMKDMLFPIDIIWIDENNKIVRIEKNISPETYPKIFTAPVKARFVLELNAGMAATYGLKAGEAIFLKPE